jgi:hypothetical protein
MRRKDERRKGPDPDANRDTETTMVGLMHPFHECSPDRNPHEPKAFVIPNPGITAERKRGMKIEMRK